MTLTAEAALALIDLPAMLVFDEKIEFANPAAMALLGRHILGENIRIALRNPAAIALIIGQRGGQIRLDGLSVAGSVWQLACHIVEEKQRLVTLTDMSSQASIARAHADFVANASHELRTPLATIIGYVETLENEKAGSDSETRKKFLGTVKREAQRMQSLIEDLMSLSRIEALKHDAPDEVIDIFSLMRQAKGEASDPDAITIESNVEEALIAGDKAQISQVLRNLIDNALKYGKPGGPVTLALEATESGWISIIVRDEGDGIAAEHLPRLTERFYRADASRSRAAGGTGLGLSIVKHIVERHRGRFDITSRSGSGTSASIMLKRAGN
jgi:two-component system, OmpR family, phosphate regulon sensor histidine kinase PhoR